MIHSIEIVSKSAKIGIWKPLSACTSTLCSVGYHIVKVQCVWNKLVFMMWGMWGQPVIAAYYGRVPLPSKVIPISTERGTPHNSDIGRVRTEIQTLSDDLSRTVFESQSYFTPLPLPFSSNLALSSFCLFRFRGKGKSGRVKTEGLLRPTQNWVVWEMTRI